MTIAKELYSEEFEFCGRKIKICLKEVKRFQGNKFVRPYLKIPKLENWQDKEWKIPKKSKEQE